MSLMVSLFAGLVALGGFGVEQNKNAPSAAEVMKYAPADFDYMFYVDLQALLPHSYRAIEKLADAPEVEGTEFAGAIEEAMKRAEGARQTVKGMAGFDPVTDLHSITVFAEVGSGAPEILAVARGRFDDAAIQRLAKQVPPVMRLAKAPDGALLAGTSDLVEARTSEAWKPARAKRGSASARARRILRRKPFLTFISAPSKEARSLVERELGSGDKAFRDLALGHEFAGVFLRHDGLGWTLIARNRAGFRRAKLASKGTLELMRASHYATRGLARVFFAALESYEDTDELEPIWKYRDEILELAIEVTGDGRFRAPLEADPKKRRIEVVATGKKLSDVLPVGGLLPIGAGAGYFLWAYSTSAFGPSVTEAKPPAPAQPPDDRPAERLRVRERYRQLRAKYPRLVESANR